MHSCFFSLIYCLTKNTDRLNRHRYIASGGFTIDISQTPILVNLRSIMLDAQLFLQPHLLPHKEHRPSQLQKNHFFFGFTSYFTARSAVQNMEVIHGGTPRMYGGLHAKCPMFLFDWKRKPDFSTHFGTKFQIRNFTKVCRMGVAPLYSNGQT